MVPGSHSLCTCICSRWVNQIRCTPYRSKTPRYWQRQNMNCRARCRYTVHTSRCRKTHAVPSVTKMQLAEKRSPRPFARAAFIPSRQLRLHIGKVTGKRVGNHGQFKGIKRRRCGMVETRIDRRTSDSHCYSRRARNLQHYANLLVTSINIRRRNIRDS